MRVHYPRTVHLPWSPGASPDDLRTGDLSGLAGREVVVTEKLDGENTTLYSDGLHARSLDSGHHPSRAWIKALQSRIGVAIPPGRRICGENLYARHSIAYHDLDSWFYAFSVWDGDHCLDWDQTVAICRRLGVPVPPVLWRGVFDERVLRGLRLDHTRQEGYVVRTVAGFDLGEFPARVAKWVRPAHVRTDIHWMYAPVVPNGLSPAAALWAVRSGGRADVRALLEALAVTPRELREAGRAGLGEEAAFEVAIADVCDRLDLLGRTGEARLAGVLAVLMRGARRAWVASRLAGPLGLPSARRIADLVGLHPALHRPFPDEERRTGLVRMSFAADLGVLHAVAGAVLLEQTGGDGRENRGASDPADPTDPTEAAEQVGWSALCAEDAGLLEDEPLEPLRSGLRQALPDLDRHAADRCWAETREAFALGRIATAEEAVAMTWRWRSGGFPRLIQLVGPSGSGKSTFARGLGGVDAHVSLDELRAARGSRADQRANGDVLREGLDRLDTALARGGAVVWDATSINGGQRSLVHAVARRRDALITHAVLLVDEAELVRRNTTRANPVPPPVLTAQQHRFGPPYPGQAHRTWYVGATGRVEDVDGSLSGHDEAPEGRRG